DVRAQELASTFHQAWVVDQVGEERTDLVCLGDGTDLVGGRLDDHALVLAEFTVGAEALEFLTVGLALFTASERLALGVAALVVYAQLLDAEGSAVLVAPDGGVLAVEERGFSGLTGRVLVRARKIHLQSHERSPARGHPFL